MLRLPLTTERRTPWWLIIVAIAPFAVVYLGHFLSGSGATGFIQIDMPYYSANGREIFERGNGLVYPNPYDPSPEAPAIYFHWLVWLLGLGITKFGFDPGLQFVAMGIVAAVSFSWLTWRAVSLCLPSPEYRRSLFLATMWGGGLLCSGSLLANLANGLPWNLDLLAFDPGDGLWFLNWGRNLIYPTEAVYHALVVACWLCVLRGRDWWGIVVALLLASTHPWSGLEVLGTLGGYFGCRWLMCRDRKTFAKGAVMAALLAAFLGYNLFYLDSFVEHRVLHERWELDWSLTFITIAFAYLPVLLLAVIGSNEQSVDTNHKLFLWIAVSIAFGLSVHDRFMSPTQPLHFTRGYVWFPLMLLGLPAAQRLLSQMTQKLPTAIVRRSVLAACALMIVLDNSVFLTVQTQQQHSGQAGYQLSDDAGTLLRWMDKNNVDGVTACNEPRLSYLLATYTTARPYLGHLANSPHYAARKEHLENLYARGGVAAQIDWFNDIEFAIVDQQQLDVFEQNGWEAIFQSGELALVKTPAAVRGFAKSNTFAGRNAESPR